jgi:23S rRNA (uracil1939-C5)-methyltransferase
MNERITLQLTAMAHGGPALGYHQRQVIFVPYGAPGDTVLAEIELSKKGWARARLLEVLTPSPDRVVPPCPHFGPHACGGCQWQHLAYPAQLRHKTAVVRDQLARLGGLSIAPVRDILAVGEPWAYRNHVQLHAGAGGLGFVAADDDQRVEPIGACPLMHPQIARLYDELDLEMEGLVRLSLRAAERDDQRMVIFETEDEEPFELEVDIPVSCVLLRSDGLPITLVGRDHLVEEVAGHAYTVTAGSFFQVNTAGAAALVTAVHELLAPQAHQHLLDLYAGVGLFSVALAGQVAQLTAVEAAPSAVLDAQANLAAAGVDNARVIQSEVLEALTAYEGPVELALADPPRAGCGGAVVTRLAALGVQRLVIVACDPAALARDARTLCDSGYRLVEVRPFDLFPQTYHIESVALFERAQG